MFELKLYFKGESNTFFFGNTTLKKINDNQLLLLQQAAASKTPNWGVRDNFFLYKNVNLFRDETIFNYEIKKLKVRLLKKFSGEN